MKYYGVSQYSYGHEYRYIFDEDTLSEKIYDGGAVPDEDVIDCLFPIGGSNSSATAIVYLPDNDSIKGFITAPADGPDSEDPMLVSIGEYGLSVSGDYGSCTDVFIKKFKLSYEELKQNDNLHGLKNYVKNMFRFLQTHGYEALDYSDPFYGKNKCMTLLELCELCDAIWERSKK